VFGIDGKVPLTFDVESTRPDHEYTPLVDSDDFKVSSSDTRLYGSFGLKSAWQFNHEPDLTLFRHDKANGSITIVTDKLCTDVTQAKNTLTQRMIYPGCTGEVTVDVRALNEGDYAGICALQSSFGYIAVTKRNGQNFIVMTRAEFDRSNERTVTEEAAVPVSGDIFRLRVTADFTMMKDEVYFSYLDGGEWKKLGPVHKMRYRLDHFTGYRFGLFVYSTEKTGGSAKFSSFTYEKAEG
jgi:beta-xylosidase